MYRDELLLRQGRPVHEADLLETWRFANRQANQGIALLASVETKIDHRASVDNDAASVEDKQNSPDRAASPNVWQSIAPCRFVFE